MPTDKPPTVSFNAWLTLQKAGPHRALANAWTTTRGRLTLATVIARASAEGIPECDAVAAWGAYRVATGRLD